MPTISLNPGLTWGSLPKTETRPVIDETEVLNRLLVLRGQWREATGGDMTQVTLNLELLFMDFERIIIGESRSK